MAGSEERLAKFRTRLAAEQERMAELRARAEQSAAHLETLKRRIIEDRLEAAVQAERVAEQADAFADYLERRPAGPGRERRLEMAEKERMTAALERRNAARLRAAGTGPVHLESPVSLDPDPDPGPVEGR